MRNNNNYLFKQGDLASISVLDEICEVGVDLIVARALLYYMPNWLEILDAIANKSNHLLLGVNVSVSTSLYIPSKKVFFEEVKSRFDVVHCLDWRNYDAMTIFAKTR